MKNPKTVQSRMINRTDTLENWNTINPLLLKGEFSLIEGDARYKVGDGKSRWRDLPFRPNILTTDPNEQSTMDQIVSAKALFDILGGSRDDLITKEKQLISSINELSTWINFADEKLEHVLYSYEGFNYLVGQFEPRFFGSTREGEIQYIERTGEFVALGRIIAVIIHVLISWTLATGPTGQVRLDGFPFIPDLANVQSGLSARSSASENALMTITTPQFTRFRFTQSNGSLADFNWASTGTNVEFTVSGLYGIKYTPGL